MHSINCLFDHGLQQEQKIVGPLKHQLADSFPIFQLTPRWELALRCASLCCVIEIRRSSKSVWVHSSIHSLTHTRTHTLTHSPVTWRWHLQLLLLLLHCKTQITITWNAFQSAAESVAYFSAPTARQLAPSTFSACCCSNIPHMPFPLRKVSGKCFRLSSA